MKQRLEFLRLLVRKILIRLRLVSATKRTGRLLISEAEHAERMIVPAVESIHEVEPLSQRPAYFHRLLRGLLQIDLASGVWRFAMAVRRCVPVMIKRAALLVVRPFARVALAPYKERVVKLQQKNKRLVRELSKVETYDYGSYRLGVEKWADRWDSDIRRRVLMFAVSDYSGSFFKWAEALNSHSDYSARLICLHPHQYGYSNDLIIPSPYLDPEGINTLIEEADIIHIKDETGFFLHTNDMPPQLFKRSGKPIVYTAYGGYMRKYRNDMRFRKFVNDFDARIAMTPDLNYDWFDGHFIPHAIDTDYHLYSWSDGLRLAHSPSTMARKGTDDLIEAIKGLPIELDLITNVSFQECIARKRLANLFFDQAGTEIQSRMGNSTVIGWYGNSAIEAAVYGIPTIAHLSSQAFAGAKRSGNDVSSICEIINTERGPTEIRKTLASYIELSSEERQCKSNQTRAWIERFHSYRTCAAKLSQVYQSLV